VREAIGRARQHCYSVRLLSVLAVQADARVGDAIDVPEISRRRRTFVRKAAKYSPDFQPVAVSGRVRIERLSDRF
jgi:hypothetical protein